MAGVEDGGSGMTRADEGRLGVWATVKKRRLLLILVVVISVVVSLPFALSAPPQYQSSAQILIPASDPISMGGNAVSRVSLELASYASSGLEQDVKVSLGDQAAGLRDLHAVPLRDQDTWLVTALADSPALAQQAVSVASQTLITHSNELAADMVRSLASSVTPTLSQVDLAISTLTTRIMQIEQQERALSRRIDHLEKSGTTAGVSALRAKLETLHAHHRTDAVTLDLERSKRDAYPGMVQSAYQSLQARMTSTAVISPPPLGRRAAPVGLVATVALAALAGLVVGLLLIMLVERRSRRRAQRIDGAAFSAVTPKEPHSLGSTQRGGD